PSDRRAQGAALRPGPRPEAPEAARRHPQRQARRRDHVSRGVRSDVLPRARALEDQRGTARRGGGPHVQPRGGRPDDRGPLRAGTEEEAEEAMTVRWSRRAVRDLSQIQLYIEADDPDAAERWIRKLWERAERASRAPMTGRIVPEYGRPDIREV